MGGISMRRKQFQTNNNFILALFIYILNEILSKLQLVSVAKFYSPRVRDGEMERFCVFINIKEKNHAFSLMIKLFSNIFFFYNMSVKKNNLYTYSSDVKIFKSN